MHFEALSFSSQTIPKLRCKPVPPASMLSYPIKKCLQIHQTIPSSCRAELFHPNTETTQATILALHVEVAEWRPPNPANPSQQLPCWAAPYTNHTTQPAMFLLPFETAGWHPPNPSQQFHVELPHTNCVFKPPNHPDAANNVILCFGNFRMARGSGPHT